jgi:hypothetical protein
VTASRLIVDRCLIGFDTLPLAERVILLRALAVEISDELLASDLRKLATDLDLAEANQRQLLLNLRAVRAA